MNIITFDKSKHLFFIQTAGMTYAMTISEEGKLLNAYWGAKLPCPSCLDNHLSSIRKLRAGTTRGTSLPLEFRTLEPLDFAEPALQTTFSDGVRNTRLIYVSHSITESSLIILLRDEYYPCEVELHYQTYGDLDLISRHAVIRNTGATSFTLDIVKSASVLLPPGRPYRITHFAGDWGAEFQKQECFLTQAQFVMESHRGTCASHQHTPFIMLDQGGTATEERGEVFFAALHWSGNFKMTIEKTYEEQVILVAGINDFDSAYELLPHEEFTTPDLTIGFSASGFEHVSELLYDWEFDHIAPQTKAHAIRPIIYNAWYPYEFDVREENMLGLIDKAAEIGAELFVIDDGWMPGRINETAGLGDWVPDPKRLPHGFTPIVESCHKKGLLFGLWVEPEMVNPNSDLFRSHPDWIISAPTRKACLSRCQHTLNFARDDIRDWALQWLTKLITDYQLDYLKWDMNRYLSDFGTDKSLSIKYIQNLSYIWKTLNERFPNVLFENCASGGGRADFGMFPFADRVNRSDNAIPTDVMLLHEGFSRLFIPKTAGGAGNISSYDKAPLDFRIHLGMTGSMSIGINLLTTTQETLDRLKEATAYFKTVRASLQNAYVYRIASAEDHPYVVWQYVCRDRRSFGIFIFSQGARLWEIQNIMPFRLRGLIPEQKYVSENGSVHYGAELMNIGLTMKIGREYYSDFQFFRAQP